MNICIIHGYLLKGTGSNLFVNNLARSFCEEGHNVYLFCQERDVENIDFISEQWAFTKDNIHSKLMFKRRVSKLPGKCILYNPNLHGLLPVYIYDEYEGFKVKVFPELEDFEIENYIAFNRQAVESVHRKVNFHVIQSNHIIMSPYIARSIWERYGVPYYITLHGSALNFTVKKDPERFNPYAEKSLLDVEKIFAVSEHARDEMLTYFSSLTRKIESKVEIIPTGVDSRTFKILKGEKTDSIEQLCSTLKRKIQKWPYGKTAEQKTRFIEELKNTAFEQLDRLFDKYNTQYNHAYPDTDIVKTLRKIDWENDRVILFVGKYLQTKGIQILIYALPLIMKELPNVHLLSVGFGSYREELEALVFALQSRNRESFNHLNMRNYQFFSGDRASPFKFTEKLGETGLNSYFENASKYSISDHIHFTGVLNHHELGFLLPCADVFTAPSIIPEAFGMVAAESLSCGVYPVIPYDGGFREIIQTLQSSLKSYPKLPRIYVDEDMVSNVAGNILEILKSEEFRERKFKNNLRNIVLEHFSWKTICKRYLHEYNKDKKDNKISKA